MGARPSAGERRDGRRRVTGGFVAAVALSAGMVAVRSGATLLEAGAVALAGTVVGALLLVVLVGRV